MKTVGWKKTLLLVRSGGKDFSSFLAVSTTDKPVNRNIHALALKRLAEGFCVKGIYLS